ncbi:23S rRNA (uracil(1939)-C(5))-methyltransferase RlmD [Lactovum odontotermitis]
MINLKIGEKIRLQIIRMGINGEGIGYFKQRLIFVPYALPEEEVTVEITENAPRFSRAKLVKIDKRSKYRVTPEDKDFAALSSSHIMHLAYPQQLEFKRDLLRQALEKYKPAGWKDYELRETLGQSDWKGYRNKLTYQLRRLKSGTVIAGLYEENSHRLVNLEHCLVQDPVTQKVANRACQLMTKYRLPIEDERQTRGLRTIMVRRSQMTGEIQVILVTSAPIKLDGQTWPVLGAKGPRGKNAGQQQKFVKLDQMLSDLTKDFDDIVTVAVNYHPKKSSEIYGDMTQIVFGEKEKITEGLLGYSFELSPRAFFQLNTKQAEVLYAEVVKALSPKRDDRVIDAYCGAGTIGFAVAKKVKSVHGMDTVSESVADARANAARLGFKNCHYEIGKAEKVMANMYKSGQRPTAVIVDPPRTGLDEELLKMLVHYKPERLVYVSCNVSTLAKDLKVLAEAYEVEYIQSVDMFPQTARCEAVVKLTKKGE